MMFRRVLPDTNVCFPISLLDLVLRLDERRYHEVIWTEDLLVELAEVWVRRGARSASSAEKVCEDIRSTFAGQDVPRGEYEHLIEAMPGQDPDDHRHAAAAVARAPSTILTINLRDFPSRPLAELGVTVSHPDDYLRELFDRYPDDLAAVVVEMAQDRQRPPVAPGSVLDTLERAGVGRFARQVREYLDR